MLIVLFDCSSDPDSTFGRATSSPATLQWGDSTSTLDLQSESEISGTKSSSIINTGPVGNGKVDFFDSKLEFVPVNSPLPISCGGSDHNASFQEAKFQAPASFESVQIEEQSGPLSGGQVKSSDYLDDEKVLQLLYFLIAFVIYQLVFGEHMGLPSFLLRAIVHESWTLHLVVTLCQI